MKYKILSLLLSALFFTSCSKSFLETAPTDYVSDQTLEKYGKEIPEVAGELQEGILNGMYSWLYTPGSGGTRGHIDIGQKGMDLLADFLCGDMVKTNQGYGWYNDLQMYQATRNKTNNINYMVWRFYYRLIFTANGVIEANGGDEVDLPKDEAHMSLRHKLGQALAMRGVAYFYLTQFLSAEYKPEEKICPIYRDTQKPDLPRSTQKEVFERVVKDLESAIELLEGFQREQKYQFNQDVARAYLAYAYAAMAQYDKVESLTAEVISKPEYVPMSPEEIVYNAETKTGSGFNDINVNGCIWGTDLTTEMGLDLVSFWGQIDVFTYSYAAAGAPRCIDNRLYASIREDDVRKRQFVAINNKATDIAPVNKFYHKDRVFSGQRQIDADYIYLRIAEMIMLNVEAKARNGKEAEAKAELKKFLTGRIADLSYIDALSGQALLDEIYLQTRIEFWGEGRSYLAMKRFKATVHFGDNRFDPENKNGSKQYNEEDMYFKIPENEELNNNNIRK